MQAGLRFFHKAGKPLVPAGIRFLRGPLGPYLAVVLPCASAVQHYLAVGLDGIEGTSLFVNLRYYLFNRLRFDLLQ